MSLRVGGRLQKNAKGRWEFGGGSFFALDSADHRHSCDRIDLLHSSRFIAPCFA